MNRQRYLNKKLILCLAVAILALQWVGLTHAHDENIDVDTICAACLAGEHLKHGVISSAPTLYLNHVSSSEEALFTFSIPRVDISHYQPRAPPVYL